MDRDIIDVALGLGMWVFGGYVRDVVIRKQATFTDIDICCPNGSIPGDFFRILSNRWGISRVHTSVLRSKYGVMSKKIKRVLSCRVDDRIDLDIVVFDGSLRDWKRDQTTDFSCNLFYISREVELGLRYVPKMFIYRANPMRIIKELTEQGIFFRIWNSSEPALIWRIVRRALALVEKGFTLRGELVTDLMYLGLSGHSTMREMCERDIASIHRVQAERVVDELKDLNVTIRGRIQGLLYRDTIFEPSEESNVSDMS
jgi:hypothetical protein